WWRIAAGAVAGVGICALAALAVAVRSALRVKPTAPGVAGDVFEDVGPLVPRTLRGRPWAFALTVAAGVAVALTVVGVAQSDPFDGALRGIVDALACLAGFAALGRYLGLRAAGD
ncbi:MAG TPA: hypothetical protein VMP89_14915, partial [Solirubrobacteraceae bacterium]|nr:hypothetical protein [Solirubrobacteraceae bacterium]